MSPAPWWRPGSACRNRPVRGFRRPRSRRPIWCWRRPWRWIAAVRLGRGGGFYDRSLALCSPATRLVAVVRDDEVVGKLPHDEHDVLMTHALTPGAGLIALAGMPSRG